MYNTVKLAEKDWCYQLYLWHDNLSVADDPYVKVIKTLIYGVKSNGNQAESGLRTTVEISLELVPLFRRTYTLMITYLGRIPGI